jgi:hypothetical protein
LRKFFLIVIVSRRTVIAGLARLAARFTGQLNGAYNDPPNVSKKFLGLILWEVTAAPG